MELGLVGLGRMGGSMRERLRRKGHTVIGYDPVAPTSDVGDLGELVDRLAPRRAVWVMVPAGDPTREVIGQLAQLLDEGDVVVDGGNSRWTDDRASADLLHQRGIGFVDCGVSGGVWGLENGY